MIEDCANEELDDSNKNAMNEGGIGLDCEEGDKSTETENEDMIHINTNENETENNRNTLDKAIQEWPDVTSLVMMEEFGNEELDDIKRNDFSEENKTSLDEEEGNYQRRLKIKIWYIATWIKMKQKLIEIPWIR